MGITIGADVPEELRDRVDEYRDDGESRSAAVERLIRAGLEAEGAEPTVPARTLLFVFGALTLGIAMEPVASSESLIAVAGVTIIATILIPRLDL
jgi:hypothetical protein